MPYWHSKEIAEDLKRTVREVSKILNSGQGGDVDTDNLTLYVKGCEDKLHVCGFSPEGDGEITTPGAAEVTHIEVSDGKQSSGGLSSGELNVGIAYAKVRKYFMDKGFHVVPCLKDYY